MSQTADDEAPSDPHFGATAPETTRSSEVAAVLRADESLLGEIFRLHESGLSELQIQEQQGVATIGYVYSYLRSARVLRGSPDFPDRPSVARRVGQSFRRVLKSPTLSADVRSELEADLQRLDDVVSNEEKAEKEVVEASTATVEAESQVECGDQVGDGVIYVYSLPHYLKHRVHSETGRTYLKVGRTSAEPMGRVQRQGRQTGLPEDPVLLRHYRDLSGGRPLHDLERLFHQLIEAADHERPAARSAGREWFATSVKFTDALALALGLEIREVNDLGD
jgi:hypothetical protein